MSELTFISLFSGIGGLDLGLERAGLRCVAQVEIDEYACQVLAKHWPDVARFRDVRECSAANLPAADCLVGGFPCQDISNAGMGAGIEGARSGLWREYARLISELRPRYIVVENVAALLGRGMGTVLGDLAARGYDAEWDVLPAAAFGAPHLRERVFIVAYSSGVRFTWRDIAADQLQSGRAQSGRGSWRASASELRRVDDGVPGGLDRIRGLGNAVVPQVAEYIGRCIVAHATDAARAA